MLVWYVLTLQKDPQAHGYTVVAFHPEVFRVSLFIFSQGIARLCKVYLVSCITMTRMSMMKTTDYTGVNDI